VSRRALLGETGRIPVSEANELEEGNLAGNRQSRAETNAGRGQAVTPSSVALPGQDRRQGEQRLMGTRESGDSSNCSNPQTVYQSLQARALTASIRSGSLASRMADSRTGR
jgi:hypothetical protein